jgi:hypothetical protein
MSRYGRIVFRAYLPAAVALLAAVGLMVWTSVVVNVDLLKSWVSLVKWLPPLALLVAVASGGIATLRMWRWQRDGAPICAACGQALELARGGSHAGQRRCRGCRPSVATSDAPTP